MGLSSSHSAHLIFRSLASKGIVRLNADGHWRLLKDPLRYATGIRTVELPVFRADRFLFNQFSNDAADGVLRVASDLGLPPGHCFLVWMNDDSMKGAGIQRGDLALAAKGKAAKDGDLVVVLVDGELLIRAYRESEHEAMLEPSPIVGWHRSIVVNRPFKPEGVVQRVVTRVETDGAPSSSCLKAHHLFLYLGGRSTPAPPSQ